MSNPQFRSKLCDSILVTIFCCWPLGIPAIVCAARANAQFNNGNVAKAMELNKTAGVLIWISVGLGLVFTAIYLGLNVLARM